MSPHADDPRPRRDMPVRVRRLQDPDSGDLSAVLDASQRVALVWELSRRMWALTGRPVPQYHRASVPVRITRLG